MWFRDIRWGRLLLAAAVAAIGALWIGQGLGAIGGSFMSGSSFWAVAGVIALLVGVVLMGLSVNGPWRGRGRRG